MGTMIKKSTSKKLVAGRIMVNVYSTPTCPYCKLAKEFLKENKIKFKDIDVANDKKAASRAVELSGQMGVPVIEIGDNVIVGFDRSAIKRALKVK